MDPLLHEEVERVRAMPLEEKFAQVLGLMAWAIESTRERIDREHPEANEAEREALYWDAVRDEL